MSRPIPVPDDFRDIVGDRSNYALARHYGVNAKVVQKWRVQCGIANQHSRSNAKMPVPRGFESVARDLTTRDLAARYGVSENTVKRWRTETGVRNVTVVKPIRRAGYIHAPKSRHAWGLPTLRHMDGSDEGQAADFLRRFTTVYRCDADGRMLSDGFFWRYGNVVIDAAELIERAERKGWRARGMAA